MPCEGQPFWLGWASRMRAHTYKFRYRVQKIVPR